MLYPIHSNEEWEFYLNKPSAIIVIIFGAPWCGPCKLLKPALYELSNTMDIRDIFFITVDIDEHPMLAEDFEIDAVPQVIIMYQKRIVSKVTGGDIKKIHEAIIMTNSARIMPVSHTPPDPRAFSGSSASQDPETPPTAAFDPRVF